MKNHFRTILFAVVISALYFANTNGQEIGWRGPGRTGIYADKGLLKTWPQAGPAMVWEATGIGKGYSSPTVTGDAVYITGTINDLDYLFAISADGKKKWQVELGGIVSTVPSPEARCTPTFINGKIYATSGKGDLVCVTPDGKVAWKVNYYDKYNAPVQRFGVSESPLAFDNKVIVTPGGNKASVVAFNTDNGSVVWESAPLNEGTQYTNPLLVTEGGKKYIITHTTTYIICVNGADGKLVWKFNFGEVNSDKQGGKNYIQTPIYKDGFIFAANGYKQTAAKIKVAFDGTAPTLVWKNADINPHVGGMLLLGNLIFSSTHDSNSKGRWICVDWTTGKTLWVTDWNNKGSVISADGLLYIFEEKNGNVALVKPNSEKLEVLNSFRVAKGDGPYWAHPVIANQRLFLRHGDYLVAYSIKAQ
jgi:outer membrane protein assembly factor BamB